MALQPPLQARATPLGLAAPNGHTAQQILPIPESGRMVKCEVCEDCGWVCESRPDRPWEGEHNEDKPAKIEKPKFGRGFISGGRIACANNNDWRACGGGNRAARQFRVRRDRPVLP